MMPSRGFSLIELMTVIAVFALLVMAVSPSISTWMVNLRIRNTADALERGLQLARQEALRRNQSIQFNLVSAPTGNATALNSSCGLSATSGSWVVSAGSPVGKCEQSPSTTTAPMLVASHAIGDGANGNIAVSAKMADKTTAATTVTFNGLGRISGANPIARINVDKAGGDAANYRSLCIEVSGVGAVRMCDPAVAAGDPRACLSACQ